MVRVQGFRDERRGMDGRMNGTGSEERQRVQRRCHAREFDFGSVRVRGYVYSEFLESKARLPHPSLPGLDRGTRTESNQTPEEFQDVVFESVVKVRTLGTEPRPFRAVE